MDGRIVRWTSHPQFQLLLLLSPVAVFFAIGLVMLSVVGHQIIQSEAIVQVTKLMLACGRRLLHS